MSDLAPSTDLPSLLTLDELAEVLRVTPTALRGLIARKTLPGVVHIGRTLRFDEDVIRAWLRAGGSTQALSAESVLDLAADGE